MGEIGGQGFVATTVVRTAQQRLSFQDRGHHAPVGPAWFPYHPVAADRVTDVLSHQAVAHLAVLVLDRQVCPVSDHHQPVLGSALVELVQDPLSTLLQTPSAALLNASDALLLPLREPPPRHTQGSKR